MKKLELYTMLANAGNHPVWNEAQKQGGRAGGDYVA